MKKKSVRLKLNGVDWSVAACLFADDTALLAESERGIQRVVDQFHSVCSNRKPRVKAGKSKETLFERKEVEMVNSGNQYMVSVPRDERYEIVMRGKRMEVVKEFKYFGTVLSKHGEMEGEVRGRAVKVRSVIVSLARIIKGRNVSMKVKRGLSNSIILPTLTYGSETWMWNRA